MPIFTVRGITMLKKVMVSLKQVYELQKKKKLKKNRNTRCSAFIILQTRGMLLVKKII